MNTNIDKYIESINNNRNILDKLLTITKLQRLSRKPIALAVGWMLILLERLIIWFLINFVL